MNTIILSLISFIGEASIPNKEIAQQQAKIARNGLEGVIAAARNGSPSPVSFDVVYDGGPATYALLTWWLEAQDAFEATKGNDQFAEAAGRTLSAGTAARVKTKFNPIFGSSISFTGRLDLPRADRLPNDVDPSRIPTLGRFVADDYRADRTKIKQQNEALTQHFADLPFVMWKGVQSRLRYYRFHNHEDLMANALGQIEQRAGVVVAAVIPGNKEAAFQVTAADLPKLQVSPACRRFIDDVLVDPRKRVYVLNLWTGANMPVPVTKK